MAYVPMLLTPSNQGTVSTLPFFEMYYTASDPHASIVFKMDITNLDTMQVIHVLQDDPGWSK